MGELRLAPNHVVSRGHTLHKRGRVWPLWPRARETTNHALHVTSMKSWEWPEVFDRTYAYVYTCVMTTCTIPSYDDVQYER